MDENSINYTKEAVSNLATYYINSILRLKELDVLKKGKFKIMIFLTYDFH